MTSYRFPVLVWRDTNGGWTASLAETPEMSAYGVSASDAMGQIKAMLQSTYDEENSDPPMFSEAQLEWVKVSVRPAFHVEKRRYPSKYAVPMRLPCVHGVQDSGMRVASLPTLGFVFFFQDATQLKDMVAHYAQLFVGDQAPRQVARCLPPVEVLLDDIVVRGGDDTQAQAKPSLDTLEVVADPLGQRSLRRSLSRAWERDEQVRALEARLRATDKSSILLVGERGCGKTAVLVDAVRAVERTSETGQVRMRHWLTSGSRLIAGMQYLGQWQERLEYVIAEIASIDGVLCIEGLRDLLRFGGDGPNASLAAFLAPYVASRHVRLVVEATPDEVAACRRLLGGFVELFVAVHLPAFDAGQARRVLERTGQALSAQSGVTVEPAAVTAVLDVHRRFMPYAAFPGRASSFLVSCVDVAVLGRRGRLTRDDVLARFARNSGVGERFLRDEMALDVEAVVAELQRRVIGQPAACEAVAGVVATFKAGLNDPQRPLAVLLMCGPTGVGKTELAKQLGRCLFDGAENFDERFIRLDMSEYAGYDATVRLLGTASEPSELVKRIRRQPFALLLLDEIEKADAAVFDVLLSVLDEGQIKDALGEVTTFRSAVIVMTSNLGAETAGSLGFVERPAAGYQAAVQAFFRPEFFNRLDAVLQFSPLGPAEVRQIAELELAALEQREGLEKRRLRLRWTEALLERLAREGYDARLGARPLQRTIEALVVTPLARWLVEHGDAEGVTLELDDGGASGISVRLVAAGF